jgi:Pre ATP-grasp domain
MTTLHIANSRTEDMVGDLALQTDIERRIGGGNAQRVAWFAREGDVLVLPWAPEDVYLDYVAELTVRDVHHCGWSCRHRVRWAPTSYHRIGWRTKVFVRN